VTKLTKHTIKYTLLTYVGAFVIGLTGYFSLTTGKLPDVIALMLTFGVCAGWGLTIGTLQRETRPTDDD
jgi:fluoride ion exporter CrcB/FEX